MEEQAQTSWVPIAGRWKFENDAIVYLGPDSDRPEPPYGIVLSKDRVRSGIIETQVNFSEKPQDAAGRIIFGYTPRTRGYFSAGLGGHDSAYTLVEYRFPGVWKVLRAEGNSENLVSSGVEFHIQTRIRGQQVSLIVNGATVMEHDLPRLLDGEGIGLFAYGTGQVKFTAIRFDRARPQAFVIMQFGEPYDTLYTEVIKSVAEKMGLEVYRADSVYRPGIILQDIIGGIVESEVVIAEITPPNPNVFYELGYAHAKEKTTILLAERGRELPFDIHGYRCIFYDNTIRGKNEVESELKKHLANIL
ncbi:hypothetical protein HYR99_04305 [Candidatus Poribacteria bacterium]|nr:hypothetical protein [Candidatus Poribacteria bacterium]